MKLSYEAVKTILWVKCHTTAKTTPWVTATTILEPFMGRRSKTPGVKTMKRRVAYENINKFIFSTRYIHFMAQAWVGHSQLD
jgi:hypothetical protein